MSMRFELTRDVFNAANFAVGYAPTCANTNTESPIRLSGTSLALGWTYPNSSEAE